MRADSGKIDHENCISLEQSQEISLMALSKGAALQRIADLARKNWANMKIMKNALYRIKVYTLGEDHHSNMGSSDQKGSFRLSQAQLKLLRQEQLMLLSENQRLVDELQNIRKMNFSNLVTTNTQNAPIYNSAKTSKLVKSIDKTLMGENEVNLMRTKLLYFVATIEKVRLRILSWTLRRFSSCGESGRFNQANYLNPQRYYMLTKKAGSYLLEIILQKKVKMQLERGFELMKNYNSELLRQKPSCLQIIIPKFRNN